MPLNRVRKLLCNLQTLKAHRVNISPVPSLSTWRSVTFKYYSSWSWIGFTSWMDLIYKYGHRSLQAEPYQPGNYTNHDYTNMDGWPAPSTARTRFCNRRWLRYSLLHYNWWQKISGLHCSWCCSPQIQCTSRHIPCWTSNPKKTHRCRNHTNKGTSPQYCMFHTFFPCRALTAFLVFELLKQGWLDDPSIMTSKGELKGDSNVVYSDSWRLVGDESRGELDMEGRRSLRFWGISARTGGLGGGGGGIRGLKKNYSSQI